jgi:hypothetical protein
LKYSNVNSKVKTTEGGVEVTSLTCSTLRVERLVGALGWGLGRMINELIIHTNLHSPNNKLINAWLVTRS